MNLNELLQLLGAKEVDLYLARKRTAELEQRIAELEQELAKRPQVETEATDKVD